MLRKKIFHLFIGLMAALFLAAASGAHPAAAEPDLICTSLSSGTWNTTGRWSCGRVPTTADDVIIAAAHNVTVNVNTANIISLTVNGTLTIGNNTTARTVNVAGDMSIATGASVVATNATHILNVGGNLTNSGTWTVGSAVNLTGNLVNNGTINVGNSGTARTFTVNGSVTNNSGATLQVPTTSNTTHSLIVRGNFTNDGTFNARTDGDSLMTTTFGGTANQTVSGTGGTTNFNLITVDNTGGAGNNIVEIASTSFAPANGFLTLTNGILKLSGSYTLSNNIFTAAAYTIPPSGGIWLDNPNITVTAQGSQINLYGSLRITQGAYNIGIGANNHLRYFNNSSFTMEGGTLSIAGFFRADVPGNVITFNMSGGTITTSNTTADSSSGTSGNFDIIATGSSFTMSGGTIIIRRENAGTAPDYRNIAGTVNITGGTVQFGNDASPAGETYSVGVTAGTTSLPNVVINQANPPVVTLNRPANIFGSLTINSGATLNANEQAVNISGDWTNNGTFTSGTQTTTFNGTAPQTISGSTTTAFSTLVVNSGATVVIPDAPTIPTAAVAVTNNGTMQQMRPVNNASVDFLHITNGAALVRYRGVTVNTGANLGNTTVTVRHLNTGEYCTEHGPTSPTYAGRCYQITPTTDGAAQVQLWALTGSELNGIPEANLAVYRNQPDGSTTWVELPNRATGNADGGAYSYAEGDTPGFSNFLLGQAGLAPTAVTLTTFTTTTAMPFTAVVLIFLVLLSLFAIGGWRLAVIRNR